MRLPDFEAWAIFAAVVRSRSFTGAAQALGLSKATISKAITRLETQIGAPLFHRTSRRLTLTETGENLLVHAERLLGEGEQAEEAARSEAGDPVGLVRLAAPMSFGLKHLGPILADFLCRYPGIKVDLHLSDAKIDLVGEGFDAALRIAALPDSSLRARKLCDVRVLPVAAPAYVARRGMPLHPHDIGQHDCLCYSLLPSPGHWRFHNAAGQEAQVRPDGPMRANSADAMQEALFAGLGIGLVPDFVLGDAVATGKVVPVLPGWQAPEVALYLLTPPGRLRPRRVTLLLEFLAEQLALR